MLKTRPELEAEAMRLIRVVNENIALDAKEVLVRALDQMQVDGAKWAAEQLRPLHSVDICMCDLCRIPRRIKERILQALENREKI